MTKFSNIHATERLSPSQMSSVKGGADKTKTTTTDVVLDDKRRDRPGGGITTL